MTKYLCVGGTSLLPASGGGARSCGHAGGDTSGTALSVSGTDERAVVEMKASGALQVTSAAEYMTYRYGGLVFHCMHWFMWHSGSIRCMKYAH